MELRDLKEGDVVEHRAAGRGRVVSISDEPVVFVVYENGARGEYDDLWFKLYPRTLLALNAPSDGDSNG